MTPQYIVCGGGSLWKKSLMCNCHCILCGYIRIDSLCFLCLSKLWPKFCGLGLSISFWMVVTSTIYLSFFLWCAHKLSICTQNVPHSQPFLYITWKVNFLVLDLAKSFGSRYVKCTPYFNLCLVEWNSELAHCFGSTMGHVDIMYLSLFVNPFICVDFQYGWVKHGFISSMCTSKYSVNTSKYSSTLHLGNIYKWLGFS